MSTRAIGWYDAHGPALAQTYESLEFKTVHGWLLDLLPQGRGVVLDVGAGTGRDAAGFAALGHEVVAVEPSSSMLREAMVRHANPGIRWLDDRLPGLDATQRTGLTFDLILLSGVWQHVAPGDRPRAFRKLVRLLNPGGVLAVTLRIGTLDHEREMYEVSQAEIESLARGHGAYVERCVQSDDRQGRADVRWFQLAIRVPDDGTGALALLRYVVLHDAKFSTYKLALLRVVARIADGAAGLVHEDGTDHVSIPLGPVALYWIRLFLPLLANGLPQSPTNRGFAGLGFVDGNFKALLACAPNDLRTGTRLGAELGGSLHGALRAASSTIASMPAHYMTYPDGQAIMKGTVNRAGRAPSGYVIDEPYLRRFGELRVPVNLWRALSRYDAWIEPAIIAEWIRLMHSYAKTQERVLDDASVARAMAWSVPDRAVGEAKRRAIAIIESGQPLYCVWSGKRLNNDKFDIDHCFPWAAWPCDDLWNLLPSTPHINRNVKRDRLPGADVLECARERMEAWWKRGYALEVDAPLADRFFVEARTSLPAIAVPGRRIGTAKQMKLLKLGTIALDGTKIHANASRHSALSYGHAQKIEAQLEAAVKELLLRAEAADQEPLPAGLDIPEELTRRTERLAAIRAAKAEIEARAAERDMQAQAEHEAKLRARDEKAASTGKKPGGKPPAPPTTGVRATDQVNLTDPESRIMPVTGKGFEQSYNAQAAVDTASMLVVATTLTQAPNDKHQVEPMLAVLKTMPENLGTVAQLVADNGYFSAANIEHCVAAKIEPLLAPGRDGHHPHWEDRFTEPPPLAEPASAVDQMKHRLRTGAGRQLYGLRKQTVEPVFGIIKSAMGFRQFLLRGLAAVQGEWTLVTMAWNIKRMAVLAG